MIKIEYVPAHVIINHIKPDLYRTLHFENLENTNLEVLRACLIELKGKPKNIIIQNQNLYDLICSVMSKGLKIAVSEINNPDTNLHAFFTSQFGFPTPAKTKELGYLVDLISEHKLDSTNNASDILFWREVKFSRDVTALLEDKRWVEEPNTENTYGLWISKRVINQSVEILKSPRIISTTNHQKGIVITHY